MSACKQCDGGACANCKTHARMFRACVRRAAAQPGFLELLKLAGEVRSEPTDKSPDGRILEGALPPNVNVERVLMAVSRAVQAVRRAG